MTTITRLIRFEFALIRMLFFRIIFERLTNTVMAAVTGFGAVYVSSIWGQNIQGLTPDAQNIPLVQSMILFAF
jgi:hypothetical protein